MQIKAVAALMQAGGFTYKEASLILRRLENNGLTIYQKRAYKKEQSK
jgi:hypothetical protein